MPRKKLIQYLNKNSVPFIITNHKEAFTAQEIAAFAHISGKDLAKTVIVKIDEKFAMIVLPATERIKFDQLRDVLGVTDIRLATEHEFKELFPDCEVGAMPPLGNLYNIDVFLSDQLARAEEITFNAGTHKELLTMLYKDFYKLVHPKIISFSLVAL